MYIFTNEKGIEYNITEAQAEKGLNEGKIKQNQLRLIEKKVKEVNLGEMTIEEVNLGEMTIEELRTEYFEVFGKEVAKAYKNNAEFIKTKILENGK